MIQISLLFAYRFLPLDTLQRVRLSPYAVISNYPVEMLIENYSKRVEEMLNEVKQMQQEITATHQVSHSAKSYHVVLIW